MTDTQETSTRILVVDDEEIVLSLARDALEDEGYIVETAANAEAALTRLGQESFDLLVTDIRMPGMDGITLVEKAHELQSELGVVFITGYANLHSAQDAIKQGALDYIMKPFELNELRQAVARAVDANQEKSGKSTRAHLGRISDLSEMLFTAGDRRSLISSSLQFTMLTHGSHHGVTVFWNRRERQFDVVLISDGRTQETMLPERPLRSMISTLTEEPYRRPFVVASADEHPVLRSILETDLGKHIKAACGGFCSRIATIPLLRGSDYYGLLLLGYGEEDRELKDTDLQSLSITASQLVISLENTILLDEARSAYDRLKDLQDQMIHLEKLATRGEISAEIAHELNNFLGVVSGNLSMLQVNIEKGKTDALGKYVDGMFSAIERVKEFTANLMDFTPVSLTVEPITVDRLIRDVVDYLRPQRRYQDVEIVIDRLEPEAVMDGDITQLQQLLYNLFNNAADAMLECKRREIRVSAVPTEDASSIRLSVTDSGAGMPPELAERAFKEKFTTKPGGHGFGLVVCRRIVDNHRGRLHVESEVGRGTTISVEFPMSREPVLA